MQPFHLPWARVSGRLVRLYRSLQLHAARNSPAVPPPSKADIVQFRGTSCGDHRGAMPGSLAQKSKPAPNPKLTLVEQASTKNSNPSTSFTASRRVRIHRAGEGAAERMVLVGRMADVCAELDRLALRELRRA